MLKDSRNGRIFCPTCCFCHELMKQKTTPHYHHLSYSVKEIKRLSHPTCHMKATNSKVNPFPNTYLPSREESGNFYKNKKLIQRKEYSFFDEEESNYLFIDFMILCECEECVSRS